MYRRLPQKIKLYMEEMINEGNQREAEGREEGDLL